MSDAIFEAMAAARGMVNDALRDTFARSNVSCFLLKRGENTQALTLLRELTTGYRVKFDDNRSESGLFRYASVDVDDFRDDWASGTHIAYGVPDSSKIELYAFADGEKDTIDPDATSPFWSGRIVKVGNERYTIT